MSFEAAKRRGHLGYAAQPGLAPFGADVFTNPNGPSSETTPPSNPGQSSPTSPPKPVTPIQPVHKKHHKKKHHQGEFPVPSTSPCTFVLTLAKSTGTVPIDPSDFTVTDDEGRLHRMHVAPVGGGSLPRSIRPGRTVSLRIHGVLPTGDGGLSWTPSGSKPIVTWDFDVEID